MKHFGGRLINCMANGQETYFGSPRSTLTRSSIDFFPGRPESHSAHLYANAQVGLFFGHFMLPDWDMFQSGHEWGAFHGAGRAISGGPVYVSDQPGTHDFSLLRKLTCSDGTVLRCDQPGQPTLDTITRDPTREPLPMKIWNRCGRAGLLGVFHALYDDGGASPVSGVIRSSDVVGVGASSVACHAHLAGTLERLEPGDERPITLAEREWEIFTIVPIEDGVAIIGLADKLNSSGALASIEQTKGGGASQWRVTLRDGGKLVAYMEKEPSRVTFQGIHAGDTMDTPFSYEQSAGRLTVELSTAGTVFIWG
jgi:raffinose synthase